MSDDLHIPAMAGSGRAPITSRYRPRRVTEPGMRTVTIAALAIGGVLLAGLGGWAIMGRRPAVVPVIEADSRPLRVKPENPGGMQVVGAEEQVMGGSGSGAGGMAPAPEVPAPQALRAQMQQQAAPAAPAAPASPAAVAPAPVPAPEVRAGTPVTPQAVARAQPAPPKPAPTGGTAVQLAAVESEAGAQAEWQRLARRMPELLGDRRPLVQRVERDGHAVFRVRTAGFADVAEATGFCSKVKAKGGACTLAGF